MKHLVSLITVLAMALGMSAAVPRQVQGVPYHPKSPDGRVNMMSAYPEDPDDLAVPEDQFTWDMIEFWAGEGSKRAALVIQWNDPSETHVLVFGYRWDGVATGADMIRAVVAAHPKLYGLIQYTNVSSPTDPNGGYTINGFGWDRDSDGDIALIDIGNGNQRYTSETGLFIHPRGYDPEKGGSSDYDYDNWKAADSDDFWGAGWYSSYWSYWVKGDADQKFSYSSWGASGRVLDDGSWDGWNFAVDMIASNWKNFRAAPNPIPEGVETEFKIEGIYYTLTDYTTGRVAVIAPFEKEGIALTQYTGNIEIPAEITVGDRKYNVTEIKPEAFKDAKIQKVTIPGTVKKIGDYAFCNSTLSDLVLPADSPVPTLGKGAFSGCSTFSQFILPEGIKEVPAEIFKGTSITTVTLTDNVEIIGTSAFENCRLITAIELPTSLKSLGSKSFSGCSGIKSVKVATIYPVECSDDTFGEETAAGATLQVPMGYIDTYKNATGWNVFTQYSEFGLPVKAGDKFTVDGVSYIVEEGENGYTVMVTYHKTADDKTDTSSIKTANKTGYTGNVVVPSKVTYQGNELTVTAVDKYAFYGSSELESVVLPEGISEIPNYTFYDCSKLTSVTIPQSVTTIGQYVFYYCSSLTSITLPENLITLGNRCFQSAGLTGITIPGKVTAIPDYCFYGAKLTSIVVPESVTKLGTYCFTNNNSLESVLLPENLESLPNAVFQNCKSLKQITIPSNVKTIGSSAFSGCSVLESIEFPEGITSLGSSALQNCAALKTVTLPSGLATLPTSLFYGCSSLETVTMSNNITALPSGLFQNCTKLNTINYHGVSSSNTAGVIKLSENTKSIAQYAFVGCKAMTEIVLPEGLTTLGGREIFKNTGLTELVIPASVTAMNQNYLCVDNAEMTFYLCATNPVTVNRFTFAKASGNYDFPVVVPTGYADTYKAASNWNYYTISEPVAESLSLSELNYTDNTLTGKLGINYTTKLPEQFALANNVIVLNGYTINLNVSAEGMEPQTIAITLLNDGTFTAEIPDIKSDFTIKAIAFKDEIKYESSNEQIEVPIIVHFEFASKEYDAHFDESYSPEMVFLTDTYTKKNLNFSSSNTDVATVGKTTGTILVKRVEGDAVIRAYVIDNPEIYSEITIHSALRTPVTNITISGGTEDVTLECMDIFALNIDVEPADADVRSYDIEISDPTIATTYSVRAFNPSRSFFELVTHKTGEVTITVKSQDGSGVEATRKFKVEDPDRSAAKDSWQDGTLWLNEDWFGHTNGSLNYIQPDGTVRYRAYESQNSGESFGCTSQYGMIYGGKLYVMSKQESDKGDTRKGGGRLVVADAKTLKKLAGFDNINGGDGRACVGVNPEKVYIGTTAGIAVFNPNTLEFTGNVSGIEGGSLYANQLGDMVCAGKYVFAIKQAYGTYVIDTETDEVIKVLGREEDGTVTAYPQGVTMTADGKVWVATTTTANGKTTILYCYDRATVELLRTVEMPSHMSITCGWGAWRPTNFFADQNEVAIWFGSGVEASIVSGNSGYYKWDTQSDLNTLQPVFVFPSNMTGIDEKTKQAPYAGVRYDARRNELLIAATHGASSNYRYNWLHFVNCTTGEISKTIQLKDYYWFPALPIFPDKYAPEFEIPEDIELDLTDDMSGRTIELTVTDRDNMDSAIRLSLDETAEDDGICSATLEGNKLTVIPLAVGEGQVTVKTESNGVLSYLSLPVIVNDKKSGVNNTRMTDGQMSVSGRYFHAIGFGGHTMRVYTIDGCEVLGFEVMDDDYRILLPVINGAYIIVDKDSGRSLKCIIK